MAKRYKAKYKSKRVGAADKALHKARMGGRPSLREGLTSVLNWYNGMYEDPQQAYDAVMQYLIDADARRSIEIWTKNKPIIIKYMSSYYWGIASLLNDGEKLDTDVVARFRRRLKDVMAKVPEVSINLTPKVKTAQDRANEVISELESEWDSMMGLIRKKLKPKFSYKEFADQRGITAEMQTHIAAYYKELRQEFVDAYKDRIEGYENFSKGQLRAMVDILTEVCTLDLQPASVAPPVKKKSYYKPKKVTKNSRKKKSPPPAFNEKAAAVVYYPEQKQIAVLFAEPGSKLQIVKKTINNIDLNKSYVKRFGKQADMVSNLKKSKFDKVAQFISTVAAARIAATTRLRDGAIVVSMKD